MDLVGAAKLMVEADITLSVWTPGVCSIPLDLNPEDIPRYLESPENFIAKAVKTSVGDLRVYVRTCREARCLSSTRKGERCRNQPDTRAMVGLHEFEADQQRCHVHHGCPEHPSVQAMRLMPWSP